MNALEPKRVIDLSDFCEAEYLALNPDVARAVAHGEFKSGRQHFEQFGKAEGRASRRTSMQKIIGETPIFSSRLSRTTRMRSTSLARRGSRPCRKSSGLTAGTLAHMAGARVQWAAERYRQLGWKDDPRTWPVRGLRRLYI